ncbi:MAG: beta-N-acetylhexosaminidase [Hyphomicrobiales bacterium]|nr:beta-N-acetylhexosaminidase [Hyphomicrobiales bacterium]
MNIRALICGCSGHDLTSDEVAALRTISPWGLILFGRNVSTPEQVARLTAKFREIVGREDAPVLIDQEGGRVQRMKPPHWRAYPAASRLAGLAAGAGLVEEEFIALNSRLMAHDLRRAGINVDCLPVLDVPVAGAHAVIGDRSYGADAAMVTRRGLAAARGLMDQGVLPVMKHIPGHGRAEADSHLALPVVHASHATLSASDFAAFAPARHLPMAMTAHIIFTALDDERPATQSPVIVERIIRGEIGFDGLLMSDDISMKALSGDFATRAAAIFAAGVDVALHCNGDLGELHAVASATPWLQGRARQRAEAALAMISGPKPFDPVEAAALCDEILAKADLRQHAVA